MSDGVGKVATREPFDSTNIARRRKRATDETTYVVEYDKVKLSPSFAAGSDPLENLDQAERLDDKSGLLEQLATHGFGKRFAAFDDSARDGPIPGERLVPTPRKQYSIFVNDNSADTEIRTVRVTAGQSVLNGALNIKAHAKDGFSSRDVEGAEIRVAEGTI